MRLRIGYWMLSDEATYHCVARAAHFASWGASNPSVSRYWVPKSAAGVCSLAGLVVQAALGVARLVDFDFEGRARVPQAQRQGAHAAREPLAKFDLNCGTPEE
jgi:hypothetical protein